MATIANLLVKLDLEDSAFQKGLDSSRAKMDKWGQNLRNVGTKMTAGVTLPLVGAGTAFVNWAADLDESMNKANVIFGDNSMAMIGWSNTSAQTMGMSQQAALDYASAFAGMFQNIADGPDQLMDMSQAMTQLTTDFGSFHNLNPEEAFTVIQSALAGETEAIRRYGVDVSAAAVETKALEMGLAATTGELTEQDKALARYQIILDETGDEQGDFARTADSTSNRLKTFRARLQDVGAEFGRVLLPAVNKILEAFMKLLSGLDKLSPAMKTMVVIVAAIAAAMGPLLIVIGMMLPGLAAMGTAIAFLVSPVGLVVIAVAALVAGLIYAYTHFEGFRNIVNGIAGALNKLVGGPIRAAIDEITEMYNVVAGLFGLPEVKNFAVTTTFDGDAHFIKEITLEDGTKKWEVIEDETGGTFGEVIESYTDAEGVTHIKVQPEGDGEAFWTTVDLETGKIEDVEIKVEADTTAANTEIDKTRAKTAELKASLMDLKNFISGDWGKVDWDRFLGLSKFKEGFKADVELIKSWVRGIGTAWEFTLGAAKAYFEFLKPTKIEGRAEDDANYENTQGVSNGTRKPHTVDQSGVSIDPATGLALNPDAWLHFGAAVGAGTKALDFFRNSVTSTKPPLEGTNASMMMMAGSAQTTDVAVFGAGTSIAATGQGIGSTFAGIAANVASNSQAASSSAISQFAALQGGVTSQASAANTNATSQFGSMQTSAAAKFMGMQASAAMQMALMSSRASTEGNNTMSNMVGALAGGMAQVAWTLMGLNTAVANAGSAAADSAATYGYNISSGFAGGIRDGIGEVAAAASAMVAAAQAAIHIAGMYGSPSRLSGKYGGWWVDGYVDKIHDRLPDVARAGADMVNAGLARVPTIGAHAGNGGGQVIHNHNYFVTPDALKEMIEGGKFARQFGNELAMMEGLA